MVDRFRALLLRILRVPHAPSPPAGAPESVRVFRAGRNFFYLRLFSWTATQVVGVVGILFSVGCLMWFRGEVLASRMPPEPTSVNASANPPVVTQSPTPPATNRTQANARPRRGLNRRDFIRLAARTPDWVMVLLEVIEVGGVLLFIAQLPLTGVAVRLEYEYHWYIVTDRSLRIRTGLLRLQETTMSFANLQQVEIKQGPLQRLLGLADLRVQSAGGGGDLHDPRHGRDSLHTGTFHGVENATEIRDLILERLRRFRESGIGDPDDHHHHHEAAPVDTSTLAAAQEVLAEARALRAALR